MTDKKLETVIGIQESLIGTLVHFQTAILGLRLELDALKNIVLSDESLKKRFAKRIADCSRGK